MSAPPGGRAPASPSPLGGACPGVTGAPPSGDGEAGDGEILAYHVVFGCYGFWLPNDPRGSGSRFVASGALFHAGGGATRVDDRRRSRAGRPHDRAARDRGRAALARPAVRLDGRQALAVARGFDHAARRDRLTVWAACVMPDHAHLVFARRGGAGPDGRTAEAVTARLKAAAANRLRMEGRHPFGDRPDGNGRLPAVWQEKQWVVFLRSPARVAAAVRYVEGNPPAAGLPPQRWPFVTPRGAGPDPSSPPPASPASPASPSPLGGAPVTPGNAPPSGDGEAGEAGGGEAGALSDGEAGGAESWPGGKPR